MIEIKKEEYQKLQDIEKKYNQLKLDESLDIANKMTSNAINVNTASKQKVTEIENISSLVNEFIEKSTRIENKSKENYSSAESSSCESQNVIKLVNDLSEAINSLDSIFETFTTTISSLATANEEITVLVKVNDQISIQTNLLSLNAKIEASRAGDSGKGFSIVADEVKKLAAASNQSTQEIGTKIQEISNMTQNAKEQSEKSNKLIDSTIKIATDATEKLNFLIQLSIKNKDDSVEVQNIVCNQLEDSDTIKSKISVLLGDSVKAIDGSSKNIDLGNSLIENLN